VCVLPTTPLRDVVVAMTKTRNGAACIVDEQGALVGFFSDGDFRRTMLQDSRAIDAPVASVMTRNPTTIRAQQLAEEAVQLMRRSSRKFSQLPVLDAAGRLVGLLDDDELLNL
jgi:arabinose-5-phosphate isomerase